MIAPTRKGYAYTSPGASSTSLIVSPDGTISNGDWMIMVLATINTTTTATIPSGWTTIQSLTLAGTMVTAIYAKLRAAGETSYTVGVNTNGNTSSLALMWGSGSDIVSNWVIGANELRNATGSTFNNIAPSLTATAAESLILALSTERTTASETDISSITGATEWFFGQQYSTIQLQTTMAGYIASQAPGATPTVTVVYPNTQASNGMARQIAIPGTAPVASFTYSSTGLPLSVDGTGSSVPNGSAIASYAWTFGDGATATTATASHTYTTSGTYTVALTVTDNVGNTNVSSQSIVINGSSIGTLANTAEGGTSGVTATVANTGGSSGTAVSSLPGTTPPVFAAAQHVSGLLSYAFQAASGATSIWDWTGFSGADFALRFSVRIPSLPAATTDIAQILSSSGVQGRVQLSATGNLIVQDASATTVYTSSSALTVNTWYDVALRIKQGSTTSNGQIQFAYYLSSSNTTTVGTYSSTTANSGTGLLIEARFGKLTGSTWTGTFWMDSLQATDTASGALPVQLVVTQPGLGVTIWNGSAEVAAKLTKFDGTTEVTPGTMSMGGGPVSFSQLSLPIKVAHRGGSANWPEESIYAYNESAGIWGMEAIEISVQVSSNGTFWCSHDATTTRMTGQNYTISSTPDSTLATLMNTASATDNPSQPSAPMAKLSDVLALYAGKRVIFIEDKTYSNQTALLNIMDANGGPNYFVWKEYGVNTLYAGAVSRGYKSWGYFFLADMNAGNFTPYQAQYTYVGLDFNCSDAQLTAAVAQAGASRVIGHIIPSAAQQTRMLGFGMAGLMIADVRDCLPKIT